MYVQPPHQPTYPRWIVFQIFWGLKLATKVTIAASSHCKCHSFLLLVDSYCFCCHWLIANFLSLWLLFSPPFLPQFAVFLPPPVDCCRFCCHQLLFLLLLPLVGCSHQLIEAYRYIANFPCWLCLLFLNWLWLPFSTASSARPLPTAWPFIFYHQQPSWMMWQHVLQQ